MLRNDQTMKIRGSVFFESKWNLNITAGVISDHLFASIPFTDEVPGLREEVPAVALTKDVFGLTFVLHGVSENGIHGFTLDAMPGKPLYNQLPFDSKTLDIGPWLAQLIGTVVEFKVLGCSPVIL